ncbi:MAG: hypothetical protein WC376_04835 [Candidatus Nanoarchaeia archaeon]|jgi:hypothetical protein
MNEEQILFNKFKELNDSIFFLMFEDFDKILDKYDREESVGEFKEYYNIIDKYLDYILENFNQQIEKVLKMIDIIIQLFNNIEDPFDSINILKNNRTYSIPFNLFQIEDFENLKNRVNNLRTKISEEGKRIRETAYEAKISSESEFKNTMKNIENFREKIYKNNITAFDPNKEYMTIININSFKVESINQVFHELHLFILQLMRGETYSQRDNPDFFVKFVGVMKGEWEKSNIFEKIYDFFLILKDNINPPLVHLMDKRNEGTVGFDCHIPMGVHNFRLQGSIYIKNNKFYEFSEIKLTIVDFCEERIDFFKEIFEYLKINLVNQKKGLYQFKIPMNNDTERLNFKKMLHTLMISLDFDKAVNIIKENKRKILDDFTEYWKNSLMNENYKKIKSVYGLNAEFGRFYNTYYIKPTVRGLQKNISLKG